MLNSFRLSKSGSNDNLRTDFQQHKKQNEVEQTKIEKKIILSHAIAIQNGIIL